MWLRVNAVPRQKVKRRLIITQQRSPGILEPIGISYYKTLTFWCRFSNLESASISRLVPVFTFHFFAWQMSSIQSDVRTLPDYDPLRQQNPAEASNSSSTSITNESDIPHYNTKSRILKTKIAIDDSQQE